MNKLSKEKRDRLILVGTITAMIIASLWFLIIGQQRETLATMATKSQRLTESITKAENVIKLEADVQKRLDDRMELLETRESEMAPEGDPYAWMLEVMNRSCQGRQMVWTLTTPQVRPPELLPSFSYRMAVFRFKASGQFHVLGKFIADFENTHRLFQVRNLAMSPAGMNAAARTAAIASPITGNDEENLTVEFEIVTPLKAGETQPAATK